MRLLKTVRTPRGANRFRELNAVTLLWIGLCSASFAAIGCGDDEGDSTSSVTGDGGAHKDAGDHDEAGKGGKGGKGGSGAGGSGGDAGKGGTSGSSGAGGSGAGGGGAGGAGSGGSKAGSGGNGRSTAGSGGTGGSAGRAAAGSGAVAGSRAGAGGSGGMAGMISAGRGGNAGSAGTGMAYMESPECKACQDRFPVCVTRRNDCLEAMGTAAAGPKAGAMKKQLCQDTLACVYSSSCGDHMPGVMPDYVACLCGPGVMFEQCVMSSSSAMGVCKEQLAAAAETGMPLDVSTRLADPTYAAGLAFRSVQCADRYCPKSCGLCPSTDPACVDMEPMP